jgi:protoporphyrinogen IX oxidase
MSYLWIKALHVLAVISWMVGMFYMPRLFVYHADAPAGSPQAATFAVMEKRLQRIIMLPALILTWITGLVLATEGTWWKAGWLHGKLLLVLLMTGLHGYLAVQRKRLAASENRHDARFFRMVNEVPTLLLIGIVILVVVKPF